MSFESQNIHPFCATRTRVEFKSNNKSFSRLCCAKLVILLIKLKYRVMINNHCIMFEIHALNIIGFVPKMSFENIREKRAFYTSACGLSTLLFELKINSKCAGELSCARPVAKTLYWVAIKTAHFNVSKVSFLFEIYTLYIVVLAMVLFILKNSVGFPTDRTATQALDLIPPGGTLYSKCRKNGYF